MGGELLHVAVDLDDVLLDFTGGLRTAVLTEYDVAVPEFDRWEISEVLDPILGRPWWDWLRERDWLWPNFPAVNGAIGGMDTLRADGHFVEIITAKPDWARFTVSKWLGKWRPHYDQVTIVDLKTNKLHSTKADLIVDDKPETVSDFAADGRVGVLFDRSHNQSTEPMPGVYRAHGWRRVIELVRAEVRGELE